MMQLVSHHKKRQDIVKNQHEPADIRDVHGNVCFITTRCPSLTKRSIDHSTIGFIKALRTKADEKVLKKMRNFIHKILIKYILGL